MRETAGSRDHPAAAGMLQDVLVPVDFSQHSLAAVRALRHLNGVRRVVLLTVIYNRYRDETPPVRNPATGKAEQALAAIAAEIRLPGVTVTPVIREIASGEIADTIGMVAREENCSLIVMARRGAGIIGSILLGSVASDLVRYGGTSILLLPSHSGHEPAALFSHVQVCTDFSDPEIGTIGADLVPEGSRTTLFHTVTSAHSKEEIRDQEVQAQEQLAAIRPCYEEKGVAVDTRVVVGGAVEEILAYAARHDVSLILMKANGRKSLVRSFIGSTSAPVARNAKTPLLILKLPL
ncbi:MAG: universal stress protein [Methanomicrobiales archaeon]|nr:universal stress protein [Methanomicrobiales archaeon]